MSTACRHCFPDASSTWGANGAYTSVLIYGNRSGEGLQVCTWPAHTAHAGRRVPSDTGRPQREIERLERTVLPGVTAWCERCGRVSVLSYSLFKHMSSAPDNTAMCMDYYNSMCRMGERLSAFYTSIGDVAAPGPPPLDR